MGKQIRYTLEYKMKTVQMYVKGALSANQLALKLGIHPHTVRHWIQDYTDGKLKIATSCDEEKNDFSNRIACVKKEVPNHPDIGLIISKISGVEAEMKELKAILQAYLLKW